MKIAAWVFPFATALYFSSVLHSLVSIQCSPLALSCTCTCEGTKKRATKNVQLVLQHRVQRKSVLQVAIRASCRWHVLAQNLFVLVSFEFLKKTSLAHGTS